MSWTSTIWFESTTAHHGFRNANLDRGKPEGRQKCCRGSRPLSRLPIL